MSKRATAPKQRPKGVPANAKWDGESQLWHAGKTKSIFSYGEQRFWRADGSVYGVAHYDKFGSHDGAFRSSKPAAR